MDNKSLYIMLVSGDYDRIHYALMTALAARAMEKKVKIFISLAACRAFTIDKGWQQLSLSSSVSGLAESPLAMDALYQSHNCASFPELLEAAAEFAIPFIFCEMGLKVMGLPLDKMDSKLAGKIGGLAGFMQESVGNSLLMV